MMISVSIALIRLEPLPMATITTPEPVRAASHDESLYEVVRGQRVELPPMGVYSSIVASVLGEFLGAFARTHVLGRTVVETLFVLDEAEDTQRRPDVAFVSYQRWPRNRLIPEEGEWVVVPDLAVEVVSPNDRAEALLVKVREYFDVGARTVWVIYPREGVVHVFETFTRIRVLTRTDALDGGAILPGFQLPLTSLFEEVAQGEAE
jgi:Uma2 family endonuclease